MFLILDARLATKPEDVHRELLSELFVSCFGRKSFPNAKAMAGAVAEMRTAIKTQALGDQPLPGELDGRLKRIAALLQAAVEERNGLP